jgi:Exonuclease C-terminal
MKQMYCLLLLVCLGVTATAQQNRTADSTAVAKALHELAAIAKNVDFTDPKVQTLGYFYKAAPYVVYRGTNAKRKWKTFCNYKLQEDKVGVDHICERFNRTINRPGGYTILRYVTESESEGTWHALEVQFTGKNGLRTAQFAFLKIGKRFGLGDIDE